MVPSKKANALWLMPIALKTLRWLLRRGSPLPISNREVKPACADGTAILWESMSLPFFRKPYPKMDRVFCFGYTYKVEYTLI
jgi:hypothetical protein